MIVMSNLLRSIYLSKKIIKRSESGRGSVFQMAKHYIAEYKKIRLGEC